MSCVVEPFFAFTGGTEYNIYLTYSYVTGLRARIYSIDKYRSIVLLSSRIISRMILANSPCSNLGVCGWLDLLQTRITLLHRSSPNLPTNDLTLPCRLI